MSLVTGTIISQPQSLEESGLRRNFLEELALKILFLNGEQLLRDLAEQMHLNFAIIEEIFQILRKDQLVEVKGITGGFYRIVLTGSGKTRAQDFLSRSQYAGPAPVSLSGYAECVRSQSLQELNIGPSDVQRAFKHLVMTEDLIRRIGTAVVSGTSAFLYGPPGAGKTSIAEAMAAIYHDTIWIPYALEVDGQVIPIYDPAIHQAVEQPPSDAYDLRWVRCRRPHVLTGGELTEEMLDLQFNEITKFYSAPLQLKANNGALIIDDLGRQRIRFERLLNRWTIPLDRRTDFLTLSGGKTFEVPFDIFVIFSTNLNPWSLGDEAFFRRIPNKIKIEDPSREQFHEIFRNSCEASNLSYDPEVVDHLIDVITQDLGQPLRACLPRDIIRQICWEARYRGTTPRLANDAGEHACSNYFVSAKPPSAEIPSKDRSVVE